MKIWKSDPWSNNSDQVDGPRLLKRCLDGSGNSVEKGGITIWLLTSSEHPGLNRKSSFYSCTINKLATTGLKSRQRFQVGRIMPLKIIGTRIWGKRSKSIWENTTKSKPISSTTLPPSNPNPNPSSIWSKNSSTLMEKITTLSMGFTTLP